MTMISRQITTDKRTKRSIKAKVLKTKVYLTIDNLEIRLSKIEAFRISKVLNKCSAIQQTEQTGHIEL